MEKILIIEDDIWISNSLKLYLENSNFNIELYHSWDKAIEEIKNKKPDLIILDINLPKKDWIQICLELRKFSNTPVIMLTARDSEYDKISWLENWADDYIAKPFSPRELLARIKAVFKRLKNNNDKVKVKKENKNILNYKDIKIDILKRIVFIEEKEISLTKNEYDLLERIVIEDWKVLSREILMTEVLWYEKYIYDRTLDTHIKNVRKKINSSEDVILTIRWEWYRLNK
jgi:DNA-binding response OmpR family regulator